MNWSKILEILKDGKYRKVILIVAVLVLLATGVISNEQAQKYLMSIFAGG